MSITPEKLKKTQEEEAKNLSISNPVVWLLCQHIHATGGCVIASDQAWYQLQSQIWSTSITLDPPSLWITINPGNLHDLIAQVFCGEDIDLDQFIAAMSPLKKTCAIILLQTLILPLNSLISWSKLFYGPCLVHREQSINWRVKWAYWHIFILWCCQVPGLWQISWSGLKELCHQKKCINYCKELHSESGSENTSGWIYVPMSLAWILQPPSKNP